VDRAIGPATIETYTVEYGSACAPATGYVIARDSEGGRFPAQVHDQASLTALTEPAWEPIGKGLVPSQDDVGLNLVEVGA